ncbi:hypothetical protein MMC14_004541 [Varicellaria rhodocarpa]|nr:hypothetical protein [Varicellaria rhodocarpa]
MATSSLGSASCKPSGIGRSHEPDERSPLINPDGRDDVSWSPTYPRRLQAVQHESRPVDEEARIGASESSKIDAIPKSTANIAGVISVLLLGVFIANADGSIVLATYGIILSDIGSLNDATWLVVTYGLAMCAIKPTYGKLSEIYGRKSMLIAAYSFGGAGTVTWQVILGRAIAGIGDAGMTSLISILIADKVPLRDVAAWRGYVNITSTVGRSAGGPFGGYLADTIGWRWSFYIQCPLALISIILVAWKLDSSGHPLSDHSTTESAFVKLRRIDFFGSASLALAIVGFLITLDLGGQKFPWSHPVIWILFASSAVLGLLFLLVEAYWAKEPIFPLRLLIHWDVVTAYLVAGFQIAAQLAVMFTVPLYFQVTVRASVTNADAHLIPAVLGNAIGGLITASYKALTIAGTMTSSAAYLLLIFFWHGGTSIWESLYIGPGGLGTGIVLATTFISLTAGVDESEMAIASTGLFLSANVGSLIGTSLASNVLRMSLRKGLDKRLRGFADRDSIINRASSDLHYVLTLDGHVRDIVVNSYVHSFELIYEISLACSAFAFLVALLMREHDLG